MILNIEELIGLSVHLLVFVKLHSSMDHIIVDRVRERSCESVIERASATFGSSELVALHPALELNHAEPVVVGRLRLVPPD